MNNVRAEAIDRRVKDLNANERLNAFVGVLVSRELSQVTRPLIFAQRCVGKNLNIVSTCSIMARLVNMLLYRCVSAGRRQTAQVPCY